MTKIHILPPILDAILHTNVDVKMKVKPRQVELSEEELESIVSKFEKFETVKEIPDDHFPGY